MNTHEIAAIIAATRFDESNHYVFNKALVDQLADYFAAEDIAQCGCGNGFPHGLSCQRSFNREVFLAQCRGE